MDLMFYQFLGPWSKAMYANGLRRVEKLNFQIIQEYVIWAHK